MRKLMLLAALAFCGCGEGDLLPHQWEFQVSLPAETAIDTLAEAEARLRSNGYVRVVFRNTFNEWTGKPMGVLIFATRTPVRLEVDDGGGH